MFRTAPLDCVLFSRSHRWVYIQVYGERDPANEDAWLPALTEFIAGFYPQIVEGVENRVNMHLPLFPPGSGLHCPPFHLSECPS